MREIDLIPGTTGPKLETAFCREKMDAAGIDAASLTSALTSALSPFGGLLADGKGVAITVSGENGSLIGIDTTEGTSDLSIIAETCNALNGTGFTSTPKIVDRDDFDLSKFDDQESDITGVVTEFVYQTGPGIAGDDFAATVVVPLSGDRLFVLDCNT